MQAVITRNQTPLERVRELGAAIGVEIGRRDPAQIAKVMAAIDAGRDTPTRTAPPNVAPDQQQRPTQERSRSR